MTATALSPRELEILAAAARGRTNKDIAAQLGRSEQTVKNHMSAIFDKLDVQCREQAFVAMGWLQVQGFAEARIRQLEDEVAAERVRSALRVSSLLDEIDELRRMP